MIVCIAEKPSVAGEIAHILGANEKKEGYYEGSGYQVTWTFGHLCQLKLPGDYYPQWKNWSMSNLPMIPAQYEIRLIDDARIKKQYKIIEKLFKKADSIINCGDAAQEGELIQRWVMQHAGVRCPVQRLWISSLTEESIREGFKNLKPQSDYDLLYRAGLARSEGDWLLGMNCSQLYSLRYGNSQTLSVGRVQTPTLSMIVERDREIEHFVPSPYWVFTTKYRNTLFTYNKDSGKLTDKPKGLTLVNQIQGKPFVITDIQKKQGKEQPPQLYDLTSLQVDCNRKFGYSADITLKNIQSLYDKKLATYPRVDTKFLTDDIYKKCPGIIAKLRGYDTVTEPLQGKPLLKSKRVFDDSKVTDHHAIIPTGEVPGNISEYERKVYDLIVKRFLAVFYPDCRYDQTTVLGQSEGVPFKATGRTITDEGWRRVYGKHVKDDDDEENTDEENILPVFRQGESGAHSTALTEKMTTPPKHYTEATLLQSMETAGKFVEDEELREAMKENGIGRPSSRAGIIELLIKRGYVRREKKSLISNPTGRDLIDIISAKMLKSPELTGQWEKKHRDLERGTYTLEQFMQELQEQLLDIIDEVKNDNSGRKVASHTGEYQHNQPKAMTKSYTRSKRNSSRKSATTKYVVGERCPICGKGIIRKSQYGFFCSEYKTTGCRLK